MFCDWNDLRSGPSARSRRSYKAFELAIERLFGERIRMDAALAVELWSALANIDWHGPDSAIVQYSFRDAGSMVAWIREDGDYMDWYCSGPAGVVAPWISDGLVAEGWSWIADVHAVGLHMNA